MLSEKKSQHRLVLLKKWLNDIAPYQEIVQIAGDASFRRYFRVTYPDNHTLIRPLSKLAAAREVRGGRSRTGTYMAVFEDSSTEPTKKCPAAVEFGKRSIAVDAPPELEDSHSFVEIAKVFEAKGLCVPHVLNADLSLGFMRIGDLGDEVYFRILTEENADQLYTQAIEKLHIIQSCSETAQGHSFPPFSHPLLMEELHHFQMWYLETHLGLSLSRGEKKLLSGTFSLLVDSALAQPQVCIHRDYHSRNLLRLPDGEVGIIDFQDALWGPVTYDLVSLIRDCYIDWPEVWVEKWTRQYYERALVLGVLGEIGYPQFKQWFDWMGMQRHLKAIFIFARKWRRDHNKDYLDDIPRALTYIFEVSQRYAELSTFGEFLGEHKILIPTVLRGNA